MLDDGKNCEVKEGLCCSSSENEKGSLRDCEKCMGDVKENDRGIILDGK
jgi:hypothetical protein